MVSIVFLRLLLIPYGLFWFNNTFFLSLVWVLVFFLAHIVAAPELKLEGHKSSIHMIDDSQYYVINSYKQAGSKQSRVYLSVKALNMFAMIRLQNVAWLQPFCECICQHKQLQ